MEVAVPLLHQILQRLHCHHYLTAFLVLKDDL
jgi:hypothetical protein